MGLAKIPEDVTKQAEDRLRQLQPMAPDIATIYAQVVEERPFQREAHIRRSDHADQNRKLSAIITKQAAHIVRLTHQSKQLKNVITALRSDRARLFALVAKQGKRQGNWVNLDGHKGSPKQQRKAT